MYVVKSGDGYVFSHDPIEMTSDIGDAKYMSHAEAADTIDKMSRKGFKAEALRISKSVVNVGPVAVDVDIDFIA